VRGTYDSQAFLNGDNSDNYGYYKATKKIQQEEAKKYVVKDYVEKMNKIIKISKKPIGTYEFPAKTCRDLKMNYPSVQDGYYFIDPNRGSNEDAFAVHCRYTGTTSETCVLPSMESFSKKKWVRGQEDVFTWFMEELNAETGKIKYPSSRSQFAHLRMEHTNAHQNMTYHCKNSHAHKDSHGQERPGDAHETFVKVMSNDDLEMTTRTSKAFHLKVVSDGCSTKDNKWHKTVFDMKPKDMQHLPIVDIAVYDVADESEEFGLDVGPVCFN